MNLRFFPIFSIMIVCCYFRSVFGFAVIVLPTNQLGKLTLQTESWLDSTYYVFSKVDDPIIVGSDYYVYWNTNEIAFRLGHITGDTPFSYVQKATEEAINAWDSIDENLKISYGLGDSSRVHSPTDGANTIFWISHEDLGTAYRAISLLTISVSPGSEGRLIDTDIAMNEDYRWSFNQMECGRDTTKKKDIQTLLTHEIGHCLGLHHPASLGSPPRVMTIAENTCASNVSVVEGLELQTLTQDDINGYSFLYGPSGVRDEKGGSHPTVVEYSTPLLPSSSGIKKIYPNPFNGEVNIDIELKESATPILFIKNLKGQIVRTLTREGVLAPGYYSVAWDGMGNGGIPVSSGVYFVVLQLNSQTNVQKIVFQK